MKFEAKIKKEEYLESHTDNIDKEIHRRILVNEDSGIKVVLESPEPLDFLKRGESVDISIDNPQKRLK